MLNYTSDFWLVFWTIIAAGATVTVLLSVLAATFSPSWFRRHQPAEPLHLAPSGHGHEAGQLPKAA